LRRKSKKTERERDRGKRDGKKGIKVQLMVQGSKGRRDTRLFKKKMGKE